MILFLLILNNRCLFVIKTVQRYNEFYYDAIFNFIFSIILKYKSYILRYLLF